MIYIAIIFLVVASLVALGNILGMIAAMHRARLNKSGGHSNLPGGFIFSILAFALGYDTMGWWAFLPTALDPGTWSLIYLPFFLFFHRNEGSENAPTKEDRRA